MTVAFDALKIPFTGNPDDLRPAVMPTGIRAAAVAAGTTQANATIIPNTSKIFKVSGADGTKGVKLPVLVTPGTHCFTVENNSPSVLNIYAPVGGTMNAGAVNAAFVAAAYTVTICYMDGAAGNGLDCWAK